MSNQSPIFKYLERYLDLKTKLPLTNECNELHSLIQNKPAELNNFFMAGLGLSTLLLRLGAVIQLSNKLNDGNQENDALFMKQVLDNLRETLPSDTNWKHLWVISSTKNSPWEIPSITPKGGQSLLERFVTFRNKFVHQLIQIKESDEIALRKGIQIFDEMYNLSISTYNSNQLERLLIDSVSHIIRNSSLTPRDKTEFMRYFGETINNQDNFTYCQTVKDSFS